MARDLYNIAQQLLNSTGCRYIWTEVKSTHGINIYPHPPFKQQCLSRRSKCSSRPKCPVIVTCADISTFNIQPNSCY